MYRAKIKIVSLLFLLLLSAIMLFSACSKPSHINCGDGRLKIVTTIFPQYDFARQIGKDKVALKMLVTPGGESHSYEPTLQDIIDVRDCDIFITAGGESDVWSKVILNSIDTSNITIIALMDCIDALEEEISEGMSEKLPISEEKETEYDEHVWTSPKNAKAISKAIT
ncbi:MAG: metal ABC transporter substrate-binding protein, partial [Ruminiclostridium sp.]|nr:metal ABC transporter substrate-binding protein [Ruminiclostridium sp.]